MSDMQRQDAKKQETIRYKKVGFIDAEPMTRKIKCVIGSVILI